MLKLKIFTVTQREYIKLKNNEDVLGQGGGNFMGEAIQMYAELKKFLYNAEINHPRYSCLKKS